MIKEFNNITLAASRKAIQSKLDELKEEFGLEIKMGNISYGSDHFNSKISVSIVGSVDEYEREYDSYVQIGYTKPNLIGLEFTQGSNVFKFRGIQPRARKNKFLAEKLSDGKLYKFSQEDIMRLIKVSNKTVEV